VGAMHGADEAALPKVRVKAGDIEHLGHVGVELEGVEGNDLVECEQARREGVAGRAGQVGELLAGHARATNVSEVGHVGGRERHGREGAEEGVDASMTKLAVGEGECSSFLDQMKPCDEAVTRPFCLQKKCEQNGQSVLQDVRTVPCFCKKRHDPLDWTVSVSICGVHWI